MRERGAVHPRRAYPRRPRRHKALRQTRCSFEAEAAVRAGEPYDRLCESRPSSRRVNPYLTQIRNALGCWGCQPDRRSTRSGKSGYGRRPCRPGVPPLGERVLQASLPPLHTVRERRLTGSLRRICGSRGCGVQAKAAAVGGQRSILIAIRRMTERTLTCPDTFQRIALRRYNRAAGREALEVQHVR